MREKVRKAIVALEDVLTVLGSEASYDIRMKMADKLIEDADKLLEELGIEFPAYNKYTFGDRETQVADSAHHLVRQLRLAHKAPAKE